jgi:predicted O-methyltransferase YrrM
LKEKRFGLAKMELLARDITEYIEAHASPEPDYLRALARETHAKVLMPRMLSGHWQGNVLAGLSRMLRPRRVLEIGTYTGYSAICLAQGLAPGGRLLTVDRNEELAGLVKRYLHLAGLSDRVEPIIGDAMQVLPTLDEVFDLVFIDADKVNYLNYYHLIFDKVRQGGWIIADNVLWSGKVVGDHTDKDTKALQSFNAAVQADQRVFNFILPVRDGLLLACKM